MAERALRQVAPYSPDAEESLLGAALLSGAAADVLVACLTPADFYVPAHQSIAGAVCDLRRIGAPVDPLTVADWLARNGLLAAVGADRLTHLQVATVRTGNAESYAKIVADDALRRRVLRMAAELGRSAGDRAVSVEALAAQASSLAGDLSAPQTAQGPDPLAADFLAARVDTHDWLVPNLIERTDRFIWTGAEGLAGKSTMLWMLAVMLSAGVHPWTHQRIAPLHVLVVDLENSGSQVARKIAPLLAMAREDQQLSFARTDEGIDAGTLRVRVHPPGLDLLRVEDRRWLTGRLASQPEPVDLLITGPLYKMIGGKPTDEEPAMKAAKFLDELRTEFGTSLMLEAHSPHATGEDGQRTLRPYGASLWMRWPEFGFGIRPSKRNDADGAWELKPWRGDRDAGRDWPFFIRRGGRWPWETAYPRRQTDQPGPDEEPF